MDRQIRQAIANKQLVEFLYHGLYRLAEPHVYGVSRGEYQLLTYQIGGESSSGGLPNWRRVNLSEVTRLRVLPEHFPGQRPAPTGKQSKFDTVLAVVS